MIGLLLLAAASVTNPPNDAGYTTCAAALDAVKDIHDGRTVEIVWEGTLVVQMDRLGIKDPRDRQGIRGICEVYREGALHAMEQMIQDVQKLQAQAEAKARAAATPPR